NASMRASRGNVEHSVLLGADYSNSRTIIVSGFAVAPPIDIYHPVYGAPVPGLFTYYNTRQPVSLLGLYVQDHMKIGPRWVVTLAGRHDSTDITTDDRIGGTKLKQSPNKFTYRAGLTWLSESGLAPYACYSTSFLPVTGATFSGVPFVPTEGKQIEGGLKFQPKGSNSFVTADVYQITQTNVSVP